MYYNSNDDLNNALFIKELGGMVAWLGLGVVWVAVQLLKLLFKLLYSGVRTLRH